MSEEKPRRARPRGSKKKLLGRPRKKTPLDDLNMRQKLYVTNKLQGKSDYQSAIQAGYSQVTAMNCARNIESPPVRRALQQLLQQQVPIEKIAQRAGEMLDATKKSYATFEGKFTDERTDPDYVERRRGLELFSQMADYWNPKITNEVEQVISEETAKRLSDLMERLSLANLPPERLAELRRSYVPLEAQHDNFNNFGDRALLEAHPEPREPGEGTELNAEQATSEFIPPDERKPE